MEGKSEGFLKIVKIVVIILIIAAIGMGGWLAYTQFIKPKTDGTTSGDEIELTWWVLWENPTDLQVLADAYQEDHPNVKINIEKQELEDVYKNKVIGQMSDNNSDTGPDIVRIHNTWLPQLQSYLSPIPSSSMTETEYRSTFYNTAQLDFKGTDGRLYAIPLMFDGLGVYYNKTLLHNSGYTVPEDTWDDFVTQAKALTQYDSEGNITVAGAGIGSENNVDFYFQILSLLMLQEETPMINSSTYQTAFAEDTEMRAATAVKFYTEFVTRHNVWDRTLDRDIQMFTEGRLAMMFAPSWRVHDINNALELGGATLDYDIAPVPQQPTVSGEGVNWSDYWGETVSAESAHSDVAWDFLIFISQPDQLEVAYKKAEESREFGEIYPRVDMQDKLIGDQYVGAYVKMADTARSWRMVDSEKVSNEFGSLIELVSTQNDSSVDYIHKQLEGVAANVNQIIAGD